MLIDRLWKSQPGDFFCLSTKSAAGKWRDHFFARKDIKKISEFIEENSDKDVYFCPHGFSKPRRLKVYAVLPKMLWADMDEADPREIKIKPTIALESSPGRFVGLWLTDKHVTEELNRRLTYSMGNDPSGWDLTQVLRVPGTTNYKYQSLPRVKTLWIDGPEYHVKALTEMLPEDDEDESNSVEETDAAEIFKEYEKKFPHWLRKELMNGKPTPGQRSEMIWKLQNTMIELGVSRDEAFVLIKASAWNKFRGRHNEDEQLHRELDKIINKKMRGKKDDSEGKKRDGYKFLEQSMDEVEEENIDWIWYPYLARGELSILEGDPGLGKSYLAQMVSAHITDGRELPSVKKMEPIAGKVAYFDIENSAGSVTKKRLKENGCEKMKNFFQDEQPFSIDDHERLEEVFEAIERLRPKLVVFDTLNTYIGKADTYKSSESTQAFGTFREIAKRFDCSVLVLRHLTKSTKERALYRGQGSIAFAGLARVVMTVGTVPDDEDMRAMAITKINVTKPPKALSFRIVALPDTVKSQDRSKFEWGDFLEMTSDDLVSARETGKGSSDKDDAGTFLKDVLADGEEVEFKRIEKMAEARSISTRTLQRAADELGIKKKTRGFGKNKTSFWTLPENEEKDD